MREVQSCAYYPFVQNRESAETEERGAGKKRRKSRDGAEEAFGQLMKTCTPSFAFQASPRAAPHIYSLVFLFYF